MRRGHGGGVVGRAEARWLPSGCAGLACWVPPPLYLLLYICQPKSVAPLEFYGVTWPPRGVRAGFVFKSVYGVQ